MYVCKVYFIYLLCTYIHIFKVKYVWSLKGIKGSKDTLDNNGKNKDINGRKEKKRNKAFFILPTFLSVFKKAIQN